MLNNVLRARLWRLAAPLWGLELVEGTTFLVSARLLGGLDDVSLAAQALSVLSTYLVLLFGQGLLFGTLVRGSQAHGGGSKTTVDASLGAGLICCAVLSVLALALWPVIEALTLSRTGDARVRTEVSAFLWAYLGSLPLAWTATCLKYARRAAGDTRSPLVSGLASSITFVIAAYSLVRIAGLGIRAIGYARTLAAGADLSLQLATLLVIKARPRWPSRAMWRPFLEVGVPSALQFVFEGGSWSLMGYYVATGGRHDLAANSVVTAILYNAVAVARAFAGACGIAVGHAVGAGRFDEVAPLASLAARIGLAVFAATISVLMVFRTTVAGWLSPSPEVVVLASLALIIGALGHTLDVYKHVGRHVLAAVADVRIPLYVVSVLGWFIPVLAFLVGRGAAHPVIVAWAALAVESAISAWIFWWRLRSGRWLVAARHSRALVSGA